MEDVFAYNKAMAEEKTGGRETRYERVMLSKKQIMVNNFLGGISWALGSVIGLGVIVAVIGYALRQIHIQNIIGDWLGNIIQNAFDKIQPR